jgi:hypothetical protein
LASADRRLDLTQAKIEADHIDQVFGTLLLDNRFGMIADQLEPIGKIIVIGGADAAFAGMNMLVVVERKHSDVAE